MEIKKPLICSATTKLDLRTTTIWGERQKLEDCDTDWHIFESNTSPLAVVYNRAIEMALNTYNSDCLILVHDDVILEEDPIPKLEKLFDEYDLVGVAGCSKAEIKSPALWHLMGGGFEGGHLHGKVNHMVEEKDGRMGYGGADWEISKQSTNFGAYPHRVIMIDGVFMALSRKMMESGVRFDEKCPSAFHFYDCIFSLDAYLARYKVGVGDILITHESPGLRSFTDEWKSGENYFLKRYGQ